MNILSNIKRLFGKRPPLRCRPMGMAWITSAVSADGAVSLVGRAVRTVRILRSDYWEIDPPQQHTTSVWLMAGAQPIPPGSHLTCTAIRDCALEPWKDLGDSLETETSEAPPKREVIALPVREMAGRAD